MAALTDKGFITNPDEGPADNVHVGGAVTQATAGAELTALADGHYQFKVPMKGVNPATEGIVWLRVGGNDGIATSKPLVVNKPEGTHSTRPIVATLAISITPLAHVVIELMLQLVWTAKSPS